MAQLKGKDRPQIVPKCLVCQHPQKKVQRRLTATSNGSTMFVCTRVGQCTVGVNLNKMDTWVAV